MACHIRLVVRAPSSHGVADRYQEPIGQLPKNNQCPLNTDAYGLRTAITVKRRHYQRESNFHEATSSIGEYFDKPDHTTY